VESRVIKLISRDYDYNKIAFFDIRYTKIVKPEKNTINLKDRSNELSDKKDKKKNVVLKNKKKLPKKNRPKKDKKKKGKNNKKTLLLKEEKLRLILNKDGFYDSIEEFPFPKDELSNKSKKRMLEVLFYAGIGGVLIAGLLFVFFVVLN
jgi:hypothetical protein